MDATSAIYANISLKRTKRAIRNISVTTDLDATLDYYFFSIEKNSLPPSNFLSTCQNLTFVYSYKHLAVIGLQSSHKSPSPNVTKKLTSNNTNLYISSWLRLRDQARTGGSHRKKDSQSWNLQYMQCRLLSHGAEGFYLHRQCKSRPTVQPLLTESLNS